MERLLDEISFDAPNCQGQVVQVDEALVNARLSNLAKNELRNRSRNPLVLFQTIRAKFEDEERPLQFEDVHTRPDDLFQKRHLREMVEQSVGQLPAHHREVFVLRELEGKSYEEIADITGVNLGTVKSRLNRARTAFADIIAPLVR